MSRDSKNDAKNAIGQNAVSLPFGCFFVFQAAKKVAGGLATDKWLILFCVLNRKIALRQSLGQKESECATIVPDLHCAVHCRSLILVKKKAYDTCFHNHTAALSTWSHAEHVKENEYLTSKQAHKRITNTKSNCSLLQTCEIPKTVFPT